MSGFIKALICTAWRKQVLCVSPGCGYICQRVCLCRERKNTSRKCKDNIICGYYLKTERERDKQLSSFNRDCCMLGHLMTTCTLTIDGWMQSFFREIWSRDLLFSSRNYELHCALVWMVLSKSVTSTCWTFQMLSFNNGSRCFTGLVMWNLVKPLITPHLLKRYREEKNRAYAFN